MKTNQLCVVDILLVTCRSLVDAVYALKDEVHELKKVSVIARNSILTEFHYKHHVTLSKMAQE